MNPFEKLQAQKILSCYNNAKVADNNIKEVANQHSEEQETEGFQELEEEGAIDDFDEDNSDIDWDELNSILDELEVVEKSESNDIEKGFSNKIHKYIAKIGNKYIYKPNSENKSINEHRQYLSDKNHLDNIKKNISQSELKDDHNISKFYVESSDRFEKKYGHKHDSETANENKKHTVGALHAHIEERVKEIQSKQDKIKNALSDSLKVPVKEITLG